MSRVRSECVRVLTVKPGTGDDDAGCTRTRVEEGVTRTEFHGFVSYRIILFMSSLCVQYGWWLFLPGMATDIIHRNSEIQ